MKILHTSDWHIGKHLHKHDLSEDLDLFFNWLISYIKTEQIDVLLVSGDIFDQANPSQTAFKQYYDLLKQLITLDCKIIITGGNHDSAAVLNAPKELLNAFDITVVGGAPQDLSELFIEVEKNDEKLVVAAVPFLKDRDIRKSVAGETYANKIEQIQAGLKQYFEEVNNYYDTHYNATPFMVMAHLYAQGSQLSESERDIQIGNQAGVEASFFGEQPNYVALGHIHKPQVVSATANVHYCGSPIALSFSEKEDEKQVNVITITNNDIAAIDIIKIPKYRNLIAFEGDFENVSEQVLNYANNAHLMALGELIINEEQESTSIREQLDELMSHPDLNQLMLVKSRLNFSNKIKGATDAFKIGTDVSDVTPLQMFEKRLGLEADLEQSEELTLAFREILQDLNL